jgi:hypothetical protein
LKGRLIVKHIFGFGVSLLLLIGIAPEVSACTCRVPTPKVAFEKSEAVFVGEFTGFTTVLSDGRRVDARRFKVKKLWKGSLESTVILPFSDIPGMCGDLKLMKGQEYLIYLSSWKGELILDVDCGRSRNVKNAAEDLKYLEQLNGYLNAPPNNSFNRSAN